MAALDLSAYGAPAPSAPMASPAMPAPPDAGGKSPDLSAYGALPTPQLTGAARQLVAAGGNLAEGALNLLGLPGDVLQSATNIYSKYIGAPLARFVTGQDMQPWTGDNAWTS